MICPNCHVPMELEHETEEPVNFPFWESSEEGGQTIQIQVWHCVICDYREYTYDA